MTQANHLADEIFSALVDDQLSPAEVSLTQGHLATCPVCQAHLAEMRSLVGLLRALPSVEPPRDFRLGLRLVADPPNVVRLRRWYAWTRAGAGALAAVFVFLSVGTLYLDSRPGANTAELASKAQPAPLLAPAAQGAAAVVSTSAADTVSRDGAPPPPQPAARAAAPAAQPAAPGAQPAAGQAPAAQPAAGQAPAAAVAGQAPGAQQAAPGQAPQAQPAAQPQVPPVPAAGAAAVRSQAVATPTTAEPGDQIAAATRVGPLPTQPPAPVPTPLSRAFSSGPGSSVLPQAADPAAPLRIGAALVGILAAFGVLAALLIRRRLRAASPSHLE